MDKANKITERERMLNASFSQSTLELMSFAGELHDIIDKYIDWFEREYMNLCVNKNIPDHEMDAVCEAFRPAITYFEDLVKERVYDFMSGGDAQF